MGTYTSRRNLYKPAIGETNWGTEMNNNLDAIDVIQPMENIVTVTSSTYTADATDDLIICNYTGGVTEITLPACNACEIGQQIIIKVYNFSSAVDIETPGSDTVDGYGGTWRSTASKASAVLRTDGVSKWYFINSRAVWNTA